MDTGTSTTEDKNSNMGMTVNHHSHGGKPNHAFFLLTTIVLLFTFQIKTTAFVLCPEGLIGTTSNKEFISNSSSSNKYGLNNNNNKPTTTPFPMFQSSSLVVRPTTIKTTDYDSKLFSSPNNHPDNGDDHDYNSIEESHPYGPRRTFLRSLASAVTKTTTAATLLSSISPVLVHADETTVITSKNPVEMKTFMDPKGLFAINVPKRFFCIRRTVKGDLPDEETGKGRRGSSIFTAGDMAKAEVVAIERFPTKVLLEEEGITPTGDLSTFPAIGNPSTIANLIIQRRDRDKPATVSRTIFSPDTVSLSADAKTMYFSFSSQIDVQKPELLQEQTGYSELVRVTLAKATLNSRDGQLMAVFASALQQDFDGDDGIALRETVDSFAALDQQQSLSK